MLRLALIENLRRIAACMAAGRIDCNRADYWADQMTEIAAQDPKSLVLVIADMARSNPPRGAEEAYNQARELCQRRSMWPDSQSAASWPTKPR